MASFAENAVVEFNGMVFDSPPAIRAFHEKLGFAEGGARSKIEVEETRCSHTDGEVVLEGIIRGLHSGTSIGGVPASNKPVELPFCAIYRFDSQGKLTHERIYSDSGPLNRTVPAENASTTTSAAPRQAASSTIR